MKPTRVIVRVDFDNGESMTIDGKPDDGWRLDTHWPVQSMPGVPGDESVRFEHASGARTVDVAFKLSVADDAATLKALQ